jgi:predicted amidohydrolase
VLAEADDGDAVITAKINRSKVIEARRAIPSLETNPVIAATSVNTNNS